MILQTDQTEPSGGTAAERSKQPARPWRYSARGVAVRLFLTCWLIYALHFATNIVREIYPALTVGDHLSFDVSEYVGLHPDIFELPGRGAFINNNPGVSVLGALPYALTRPLIDPIVRMAQQRRRAAPAPEYNSVYPLAREFYRKAYERGLDIKFGLAAAVMQMLLMAPFSAFSAVVMFYVLLAVAPSIRAALLLALLYAFATPVFYRTAQLNQNIMVSHATLFAFALLWRPWDRQTQPPPCHYFLAGVCAGSAVVFDYSGLVSLLFLGVYAVARHRSATGQAASARRLWLFAGGSALCLSLLLAYQWMCFGSPFYPAQHYMPPTQYSSYGFNGMGLPQADLLWETAFGLRFGLFVSAPMLMLALYLPAWRAHVARLGGLEVTAILSYALLFFLFASANQYGRLQFNSGVRYVVPVTPVLFLLSAGVLLRMARPLALGLGIVATYWSWCLAMYRDVEQGRGIVEAVIQITRGGIRLPWVKTLEQMGFANGAALTAVALIATAIALWLLWRPGRPARGSEAWAG